MADIIPFPKIKVSLTEDEYQLFEQYKEKMERAKTKAEMDFYYNQAKIIIEKANNRKN